MHFTTLGYSRSDGQTCDHWTKGGVARLEWEPEFHRYVRDAFAPVGLMIDYWKDRPVHGTKVRVPVILTNDLDQPWRGPVILRLQRGNQYVVRVRNEGRLLSCSRGQATVDFPIVWPEQLGPYTLEAQLTGADGEPVRSVRAIEVVDHLETGLTFHKPVTASSTYTPAYKPEYAVDDDPSTYWSSDFKDGAWLAVDLGAATKISRVRILPMGKCLRESVFGSGFDGWQELDRRVPNRKRQRRHQRDQVRSRRGAARAPQLHEARHAVGQCRFANWKYSRNRERKRKTMNRRLQLGRIVVCFLLGALGSPAIPPGPPSHRKDLFPTGRAGRHRRGGRTEIPSSSRRARASTRPSRRAFPF